MLVIRVGVYSELNWFCPALWVKPGFTSLTPVKPCVKLGFTLRPEDDIIGKEHSQY